MEEMTQTFGNLNNRKTAGVDKITAKMKRDCDECMH